MKNDEVEVSIRTRTAMSDRAITGPGGLESENLEPCWQRFHHKSKASGASTRMPSPGRHMS